MGAIRNCSLILLLVALSALATHATINIYPYAEDTRVIDVGTRAYIPSKGKDLKSIDHDCGKLVTSLVAKFRTEKFSTIITPLKTDYDQKQAIVNLDSEDFRKFVELKYPTRGGMSSIDLMKQAYKASSSYQITQYNKASGDGRTLMAVIWAMKTQGLRLTNNGKQPENVGKEPTAPDYTFPSTYPFKTASATDVEALRVAKEKYDTALKSATDADTSLSGVSVVGVALVDVGTATTPDVRAYFAPSGSESNLNDIQVGNIKSLLPKVDGKYQNWEAITAFNADLAWKSKYQPFTTKVWRTTPVLNKSRVKIGETRELVPVTTPAEDTLLTDPGIPAGITFISQSQKFSDWKFRTSFRYPEIYFAMQAGAETDSGPTISKKWKYSDPVKKKYEIASESASLVGTCALQKLVYGLFGTDRVEFGLAKRLYKGAQVSRAAPKLICAAEAVNKDVIKVFKKDASTPTPYGFGEQVPSCVACQAVLPDLMSRTSPAIRFTQLSKLKQLTSHESLQPHTE